MRYYRIEIASFHQIIIEDNGAIVKQVDVDYNPKFVFTSHLDNGQMNSGALNIIMNITLSYFHLSSLGESFVQIQGMPLSMITQANNLRGKYIRIWGGKTKD